MARPREFDRETVLEKAVELFWAKGFAATSTDDLVTAMGLGRQSLYNAFGGKRRLYLEALGAYQQKTVSAHLARLNAPDSPLDGVLELLVGLAPADDALRGLGCMGVGSVCEFGAGDPDLIALRRKAGGVLDARLAERLREGQARGEIDPAADLQQMSRFVQMAMTGLQVAARGGASDGDLRALARFTVDRLKAD